MARILTPGILAAFALLLAGCAAHVTPPYRRVDTDAPEFKAAVARETAAEEAKGASSHQAAGIAVRRVTDQAIAAEKERRTDMIAPLTEALAALDRPRGCWAYTATVTTQRAGKTAIEVERFDPSQPDERLWTLITRDGQTPPDAEQAKYRRARLSKWQSQQDAARKRKTSSERVARTALYANLKVDRPTGDGPVSFSFDRETRPGLLADIPGSHETYLIDEATSRVIHDEKAFQTPVSALGGSIQVLALDLATDYVVVDHAIASFPAKTKVHYRLKRFGIDTGDVVIETTYADHRRVKCYQDRFEVQIGTPTLMDVLPEK
jgi:hypothetical protein